MRRRLVDGGVRLLVSLWLVGCVLPLAAPPVEAQSSDIIVAVDEVDLAAFPQVSLRVSVRSRNGVPISGLQPEHFEVVEDGANLLRPTGVSAESSPAAQVSLAIVIDTYRTLSGAPIEAAQQATNDLLAELLEESDDADRAAFVAVHRGISTDAQVLNADYEVPFTNDRNLLLNVINFLHERMETSAQGTPLYDATIKAIRLAAATEPVAHRAVIVMTDGEDRDSISTDADVIQTASNERTPVFTVGLSNSRLNEQFLRRLADQTGGTYQAAETPDDFSPLFNNVLTMLRTQYVLTYDSGLPEDGQPHSVLVHVRTPTQMEGYHEQRIQTPGSASEASEEPEEPEAEQEATEQPLVATPVLPTPTAESDFMGSVRNLVEDNLLLVVLGIAAIGLMLLLVVIIIVVVIRRRRAGRAEEAVETPPLPETPGYVPSYEPSIPSPDVDASAPTGRARASADWSAPEPVSSPTMPSGAPPIGQPPAWPPAGQVAPPPPPPAFAELPDQFQPAGGTRILDRGPKMGKVGLLVDTKGAGRRFDVAKVSVVVGRVEGNDVQIDHPTVSRQHAAIKWEGEQFRLYDMGSSNGTFVGEQRVREPVVLNDGDRVRFGAVEFVFKIVSLG
ncbi:MAG: FHA domain-containing protein [Anaerolineales bacterium]|nr:FHA domain-containing protein [Anaerolineales bacterium]